MQIPAAMDKIAVDLRARRSGEDALQKSRRRLEDNGAVGELLQQSTASSLIIGGDEYFKWEIL